MLLLSVAVNIKYAWQGRVIRRGDNAAYALAAYPEKRDRSVTLAGMFLSLVEGIDNLPTNYVGGPKEELVDVVLDVLIHGI